MDFTLLIAAPSAYSSKKPPQDRFGPHVLAPSLLFRMSELRQGLALIRELSVFTALLFSVALGPQMEDAGSRVASQAEAELTPLGYRCPILGSAPLPFFCPASGVA